jgi:rhodanese-related sulfurtransferase
MNIKQTLAALAGAAALLVAWPAFAYDDVEPWKAAVMVANQDAYILDVRTGSEWTWVGRPGKNRLGEGDYLEGKVVNISYKVETAGGMVVNPSFVADVMEYFDHDRKVKLIAMCRSGGRSVEAAEALEAAGFKKVYNMTTGFEGHRDVYGYRTLNGWKVDGFPYKDGSEGAYGH